MENQKPKLVLFDIDGTLIDSHYVSMTAYHKCLSKIFDKEVNEENSSAVLMHGPTELNLITKMAKHHLSGATDEILKSVTEKFFQLFPTYIQHEIENNERHIVKLPGIVRLFDRIWELREEFKTKKIHFGLLTGNSQINSFAKLQAKSVGLRTDILESDFSVFGDKYLVRSDMLPGLWKATKSLGYDFSPDNTLIVGDTPLDIKCAKDNMAKALAVATGIYGVDSLKTCNPDYVMENLENTESVCDLLKNF